MTTKNTPTVGQLIRQARLDAGMSYRELGEHLGVSGPYLHDVENDRRRLAVHRWVAICEALPMLTLRGLAAATVAAGRASGSVTIDLRDASAEDLEAVTALFVRMAKVKA